MRLEEILKKENNNIDLLRLIAACMVIYGHGFAIAPTNDQSDLVVRILKFDYSGSLAVKAFFFLSGLVVANSLLSKKDISSFVIGRILRIMPGLLAVLCITAFLIGPLVSNLALTDYYFRPEVYRYITNNLIFRTEFNLPGVFDDNNYPGAVNGSLWTLKYEIGFYMVLLSIFVLGGFKNKTITGCILALIAIDPVFQNKILFTWRQPNAQIDYLAPAFAFGVFCAAMKDRIEIRSSTIAASFLLYCLFKESAWGMELFYLSFFLFLLYLSSLTWFVKLRPRHDISYGMYLWGFPVQQCISHYYRDHSAYDNILMSLAVCLPLSWMMFVLIEKPSIRFGQKISLALASKIS